MSFLKRVLPGLICLLAAASLGFVSGRLSQPQGPPQIPLTEGELNLPFEADPNSFAVFPCTRRTGFDDPYAICVLVIAGGKRLVFGAPLSQDWRGIGKIDGVFLPNGHPVSIGGLMGLRHRNWWSGKPGSLSVVGGELLIDEIRSLEAAQSRADALMVLETDGAIDFLNAALRPKPVPSQASRFKVFDTGDLQVFASSQTNRSGDQILSFDIQYGGRSLFIQPCGGKAPGRPVNAHLIATADKSTLVALQRQASSLRQEDLVRDYQRMGESCLSSREAVDRYASQSEQLLLIRPERDLGHDPDADDHQVISLTREGVIVGDSGS